MAQNQKKNWQKVQTGKHHKGQQNQEKRQQVIDKSIQQQSNTVFNIPRLLFISLITTLIVYIPSLFNDFVSNWDDGGYVLTDEAIRILNAENLKIIFTRFYQGNYHPLTTLMYAFQYQIVGLHAFLYHLVNLTLHLLNVWLVYRLILKISNRVEIAFITSLLFGIHPMHVESVAWISELKDVMYAFFFLLTTIFYLNHQDEGKNFSKKYWFSLGFFALSLMSKSAAVSLPVSLVAIDMFRGKKFTLSNILDKIPFFLLSVTFGIVAILSQDKAGAIQDLNPLFTWGQRAFLASYAVMMYISRLFVPFQLATMHPYPELSSGNLPAIYYMAPILIVSLALLVFFTYKKTKVVWFGILYFFITIALVLQILPVGGAIIAERYTYIPYIGLFFIFGWLYTLVIDHAHKYKSLAIGILTVYCISMSINTVIRIGVWKSGDALFDDVTKKYPNMPFGFNNLGYYYYTKLTDPKKPENPYTNFNGDKISFDQVIELYSKCVALDPTFHMAFSNRGVLYFNTAKEELAIKDFDQALKLKPDLKDALIGRANSLSKLNRFRESIPDYNRYIQLYPKEDKTWEWLGTAYYRIGEKDSTKNKKQYFDTAIIKLNQAVILNPKNSQAFYFRGLSNYQKEAFDLAIVDFDKAFSLNPDNTEPMTWKAFTYFRQKNYPETIKTFSIVIDKDPQNAFARLYRGNSFFQLKRFNDALSDYSAILNTNPQNWDLLEAQAHAYFEMGRYKESLINMETLRRVPRPFDIRFYNLVLQKAR